HRLPRLRPQGGREIGFVHGWASGDQKDGIIEHETQHSVDVTGFGRRVPRGDELADLIFVALHGFPRTAGPYAQSSQGILARYRRYCIRSKETGDATHRRT